MASDLHLLFTAHVLDSFCTIKIIIMTKYLYEYKEIKNISIGEFISVIEKNGGKRIIDLTISDLIFNEGKPIHTGCGVYLFVKDNRIFYVGKNSARCFVERIPSHFDIRKEGWFNRLLRLIAKVEIDEDENTDEGLRKAAKFAIDNFEVILINFNWWDYEGDTSIEVLEDLLRMTTNAANSFKTKRNSDLKIKIKDFVNSNKVKKKK